MASNPIPISQTALSIIRIPIEGKLRGFGRLAIPLQTFIWTSISEYTLDVSQLLNTNKIDTIKSIWIDNSNNNLFFTATVSGSGQVINFPPGMQGFVELIAPNPVQFTFQVTGAANGNTNTTAVILLNYSVAGNTWNSVFGGSNVYQAVAAGTSELFVTPGYFDNQPNTKFLCRLSTYIQNPTGATFTGNALITLQWSDNNIPQSSNLAFVQPTGAGGRENLGAVTSFLSDADSGIDIFTAITGTIPNLQLVATLEILQVVQSV